MVKVALIPAVATAFLLVGAAARADDIAGAGSGSNGGVITGTTNETGGMMQTGTSNGQQPARANGAPLPANAYPDDAVLNAPREAKPGTTGQSQPSNLNGQNPQ